jgi:hypothetical protein
VKIRTRRPETFMTTRDWHIQNPERGTVSRDLLSQGKSDLDKRFQDAGADTGYLSTTERELK